MRYLPGFIDLIYLKFINIGELGADIKYKNGHEWGHIGSPMARIWHVPYYHIVKGFFKLKGPQLELI